MHLTLSLTISRTIRSAIAGLMIASLVPLVAFAQSSPTGAPAGAAALDPVDDCTVWYVGDYLKRGAASYSTRIGAFRMPGCPTEGEP